MNQNTSVAKIRLNLLVAHDVTIVSPTNPAITSKLTAPCLTTATIELFRGVEWAIIHNLSVPYGLPVHGKGRSLHTAWDNMDVEVTRLTEDGTEEEYFNE